VSKQIVRNRNLPTVLMHMNVTARSLSYFLLANFFENRIGSEDTQATTQMTV
jgi:hypothetical protein